MSPDLSFPPTETRLWKHSMGVNGGDNPGDSFHPQLCQGSVRPRVQERPFTHSSWIVALPGGAAIKAVRENDLQAVG